MTIPSSTLSLRAARKRGGGGPGLILGLGLVLAAGSAVAEQGATSPLPDLDDAVRVTAGEALWQQQCRHCHGRSAYPGKAPKLKPRKYKPEFVYDRITNGFRKMPPWKDVYDEEQRWSLVAYVLSRSFSP